MENLPVVPDPLKKEIPPNIKKIAIRLTNTSIARCYREGISLNFFHETLRQIQIENPKLSLSTLVTKTFTKIKEMGRTGEDVKAEWEDE